MTGSTPWFIVYSLLDGLKMNSLNANAIRRIGQTILNLRDINEKQWNHKRNQKTLRQR